MRSVTLNLDDFGREALDGFVRQRRDSHAAAVRMASLYYLADFDSGRSAWRVPQSETVERGFSSVTVRLDDETWQAVQTESERQGVSPGELTRHAVLYFLADVDSGRVGTRLERALNERPDQT